ncbi:hypothetical protein HRbin04_00482 [archaeon HR04]|nr:hypothetical protein HRbin04_00482 [archaeon HR04]
MNNKTLSAFIDESGDLGFTDKSSPYFVIASVIIEDNDIGSIRQAIKRLLKCINIKKKSKISEFKYSRDSIDVKKRFLEKIIDNNNLNFKIGYVAIDKTAVKDELKYKKDILYNFAVIHYTSDHILRHYNPTQLTLIIDRSLGKEKINAFNEYANKKVDHLTSQQGIIRPSVKIVHKDSKDEPLLQLADYIAGILYAKLVNKKESNLLLQYQLIKQRLLFLERWPRNIFSRRLEWSE